MYTGKIINESEEKSEYIFDAAFETVFEIVSVFKEASTNFIFIFLLNEGG
jgi:hypothetical protein